MDEEILDSGKFEENNSFQKKIDFFNNLSQKILTFDSCSDCLISCKMCTFAEKRKKGLMKPRFMKSDQIKKICLEFIHHKSFFQNLVLSVSGEPLLNPDFEEIITQLFEINTNEHKLFRYISINTNAILLDNKKVDLINKFVKQGNGWISLNLSIDAASRATYEKVKGGDYYNDVIKNIKYLLDQKKKMKFGVNEMIYFQILAHELNEHEIQKFVNFWSTELEKRSMEFKVDYAMPIPHFHNVIIIKRIYEEPQKKYDELHKKVVDKMGLREFHKGGIDDKKCNDEIKHLPVFEKTKRVPCGSLWLSPIIRADGTLNVCLTDVDNHLPLGNVFKESFFKLWFSDKADSYRKIHIKQTFKDFWPCEHCYYFDGVKLSETQISEYKKLLGI